MLKKNNNKLIKSYEILEKKEKSLSQEVQEWNKLYSNRNQRIDAWKNSR